jgi:acyl-CoA thioesterase I
MAFALAAALALGLICPRPLGAVGGDAAGAAEQPNPAPRPDLPDGPESTALSPECRVPGSKLYTIAPLRRVRRALRERRTVKVLAIGSSSTLGSGASSPAASYPARLEDELEKLFPNVNIDVVNRGISGEIATGAAERMKAAIAEVDPDLVVWQVGANDALARVDPDTFSAVLNETVQWLQAHKIDVVLVDPQYAAALAQDDYYARIVQTIETVSRRDRVPLVRRFEAMRYLAGQAKSPRDGFQLSDLGYRCMAEHVAHAITVSLIQAEAVAPGTPPQPVPAAPSGDPAPPR